MTNSVSPSTLSMSCRVSTEMPMTMDREGSQPKGERPERTDKGKRREP